MASHYALVFGASGIAGWGICNALVLDPSFKSVIATTVRTLDDIGIAHHGRASLISGVELTDKDKTRELLQKTADIENVTHVYYAALLAHPDVEEKCKLNIKAFENAVTLVNELCPRLKFLLIQTGSMYYGLEYSSNIPYEPPFLESRARIPAPFYDKIYYHTQLDWLASFASDKKWQWAESRPDMIAGFVPTGGSMNIIGFIALYLATYRYAHGDGAKVQFPGTEAGWNNKITDCNQDLLGRFDVWLSTCGKDEINGQAYNVANGEITTWEHIFPRVAEWFGLQAVAPKAGEDGGEDASNWWQEKGAETYKEMVKAEGLKEREMGPWQWGFTRACTSVFCMDRYLDLGKVKALGWNETEDSAKGYLDALDKYAGYGVIPDFQRQRK